jgi:hypothetical protein
MVCFILPRFFVRHTVLRYGRWKQVLLVLFVAGMVASSFVLPPGHRTAFPVLFWAFYCGYLFWAVNDDCLEMVEWLSHPTEYGRPPEEIHLLAERRDAEVVHRLWRYRYGDEWDVGITGNVTFAFEDGRCNAMSPEEIFNEYLGWYEREGIEKMLDEAIEEHRD